MIAIVVSRADSASEHIGEHLLDLAEWESHEDGGRPDADGGGTFYRTPDGAFELRTFDDLHIYLDDPAPAFDDPDLLVFVSRHSGETGPLLTAHFTGNFGPAEYGGDPGGLARACPNAQDALVEAFDRFAPEGYDVGIECTHHGPSHVSVPSLFAELGSSDPEWEDPEGARAVARTVLTLDGVAADRDRQLVGFGGGHYAPRFLRILRETDWAVGHIGAEWPLKAMGAPEENRDVVARAFEASAAEYAVVDGDYPELEAVVSDLGYRVVSETWVRETSGVDLALVEALESSLSSVDGGLRLGARTADCAADAFETVSLPADLLAETQGIDAEATREVVRSHTVAFETRESGTRAVGRAAICDPADRDGLVDGLVDVLREKYDAVDREGETVVAHETTFDPEAAHDLGVPEGPAFGKLAGGRPVEVDGTRIDPSDVQRDRTVRFQL